MIRVLSLKQCLKTGQNMRHHEYDSTQFNTSVESTLSDNNLGNLFFSAQSIIFSFSRVLFVGRVSLNAFTSLYRVGSCAGHKR